MDIDDLKAMLRQLITERFQLKSHSEERPVTAYTLLAGRHEREETAVAPEVLPRPSHAD